MKLVNAKYVEVPTFGMFIKRKIDIKCGNCGLVFKDKPEWVDPMVSKCPYCGAVNKLPLETM
jgi:hypothetical protein